MIVNPVVQSGGRGGNSEQVTITNNGWEAVASVIDISNETYQVVSIPRSSGQVTVGKNSILIIEGGATSSPNFTPASSVAGLGIVFGTGLGYQILGDVTLFRSGGNN